jgi:hypothetical protein
MLLHNLVTLGAVSWWTYTSKSLVLKWKCVERQTRNSGVNQHICVGNMQYYFHISCDIENLGSHPMVLWILEALICCMREFEWLFGQTGIKFRD